MRGSERKTPKPKYIKLLMSYPYKRQWCQNTDARYKTGASHENEPGMDGSVRLADWHEMPQSKGDRAMDEPHGTVDKPLAMRHSGEWGEDDDCQTPWVGGG